MSKLKVPINDLRRSIAKNEKSLNVQKKGLALLEQAEATLAGGLKAPSAAKKYTQTPAKDAMASPAAVPSVELSSKNRPRPKWSAERRAKTLLSLAKARAAKAKLAKSSTKKKAAK